jgi:hypothetical protein
MRGLCAAACVDWFNDDKIINWKYLSACVSERASVLFVIDSNSESNSIKSVMKAEIAFHVVRYDRSGQMKQMVPDINSSAIIFSFIVIHSGAH